MVTGLGILLVCSLLVSLLAAAETFPVCQQCNCAILPTNLNGRVVDVPTSPRKTDWFVFNDSIVSNQTVVLLFRSVEPSCKVEIKLKSVTSTVQFLIYPAGRQDPTIATDDLGPVYTLCYGQGANPLLFGTSASSSGSELALVFPYASWNGDVILKLQLFYRQHCANTRNVEGIPLVSPPLNGSAVRLQLTNLHVGDPIPVKFGAAMIAWSITPPSPNCSLEATFTNSTRNSVFGMNQVKLILVGVTHRLPKGQEAIIRLWKSDPFSSLEAAVNVEYRAVECGVPLSGPGDSSALQILSWNTIIRPLKRIETPAGHDPWHLINFTFANDGAQQVAIWVFSGPEPAYIPFSSLRGGWPTWISRFYFADFIERFNGSMITGTLPVVLSPGPLSSTFQYAYLPDKTPPVLVAVASSSTPTELVLTKEMLIARKLFIKAANASCAVAVWRLDRWDILSKIRVLPFGFDSTLNDLLDNYDDYSATDKYAGSGILWYPTRSVGPVMGIQFYGWTDLESSPKTILYRMVCPKVLGTAANVTNWRYVNVSSQAELYLLPQPAHHEGKQCWVDISSVSTARNSYVTVLPRDGRTYLRVTCLQLPMRAEALSSHRMTSTATPCNGTLHVDAYAFKDGQPKKHGILFAYRVRCEGDSAGMDDGLAPIAPLKKLFVADDKWRTLNTAEYEYEEQDNYAGLRNTWMLQAKSPNCRVEIQLGKAADMVYMDIVEDFMTNLEGSVYNLVDDVKLKHLRYVSCDRRVFLVGLHWAIGKKDKCKYREVCGKQQPGFGCSQDVIVEPSEDGKWQTMQAVSNGNLNQLFQLHYHITKPFSGNDSEARNKVLEMEFTSLISAESWSGIAYEGRYGWDTGAETHGLWINDRIRVIAGKQFLFKDSVRIKVDALARAKRGDLLFTLRYRLVDAKRAREEIRLGEVLTATKKLKTLDFKVPQQFSATRLKDILENGHFENEDSYNDMWGGDFPVWFFRHYYTLRPSNASCQVALRFTKMDIGSGYISGSYSRYKNDQHRLSILTRDDVTKSIPLFCSSDVIGDFPNRTVCGRMDRTYLSAPGSALGLLFKSADIGEYEFDNPEITGFAGPEVTIGSGWSATYQEICDATKAAALANIQPMLIKARNTRKPDGWQQGLPGLLLPNKVRLFRDKRWLITPERPGCSVQWMVETKKTSKKDLPLLVVADSNVSSPILNEAFTSSNVTIIQLGTNIDYPFTIKFRQVCTQAPTSLPTWSPTHAPVAIAGSRRDGETCTFNWECGSSVCSRMLLRCTAKACPLQCASKNGNQPLCKSYAVAGCSCDWSSMAKTCVSVA